MTLTAPVLRSWQPGVLRSAAQDLRETADLLGSLRTGVGEAMEQMLWEGAAGDAARASGTDLVAVLGALRASVEMQAEALSRARDPLELAQEMLAKADNLAAVHGLLVLPDGSVTAPPPDMYGADSPPEVIRRITEARNASVDAQARAQSLARGALASASECDRDAAEALLAGDGIGRMLSGIAPAMGGLLGPLLPTVALAAAIRDGLLDAVDQRPVPAHGSDPAEVSAWWASLPASAQQALLAADPLRIGNLDGMPAAVRDQANRAALAGERAALLAESDRLNKRLDDNWFGGLFTNDDAALGYIPGKLAALDAIEATLAGPDRQLLVLDLSDEQAMAAIANGDVDTADHVAVFTPGLTTTVQDSLVGTDRQLAALRQHARGLAAQAGTGTVATVSWLGYEAPQWADTWRPSRSVAGTEAAERGAVRLSAFYNGLDAARAVPAHVTALGHSYGSLTTGLALARGTGVDDAVFFGSPGLGTDKVEDLGLAPGHAYVVEARNDPVADLAAFGIDPNQMTGMTGLAATEQVVDGKVLKASTGHSEYLTNDTTSQYGMAAVVAGVPQAAPRDTDEGRGFGDILATPVPEWLR